MIVSTIEDLNLYAYLKNMSNWIREYSSHLKFSKPGQEYDLKNDIISPWFNPNETNRYPTSRTYPIAAPEQLRPEYSLILYPANYLALTLITKLYNSNKEILIEDIGAGLGRLLLYLHSCGFNKFHVKENFSQISQKVFEDILKINKVKYTLNDSKAKPVIINNVGVPDNSVFNVCKETELLICYTNRSLENWAEETLIPKGYRFLCKDQDDFAFAYCREDKYLEFKGILK